MNKKEVQKPMHLLMIAPEQIPVPPPKGGSVEICMLAIAKKLSQQHIVTLMSRRFGHYPHISSMGNLTIVRVPSLSTDHYISAVLAYIRGKHYDWIQIDNRPRFVTPVRKDFPNTPISVFLHSLTFVSIGSNNSVENHLAQADKIIANSSSLQRELSTRFPELIHKIMQVHLGVDLHQFRPPSSAQRENLRKRNGIQGSFVFAFAGRMIPRKGIPVLLRALSLVRKSTPNVKLVLAGRGKSGYMSSLKKKVKNLHLSAKFIGYKSHRSMHEVYWMADCLVCPSQKHEAFGLVNVEAMATGIPVIASKIGGMEEIIRHDKNGLLIDNYKNANAFAAAMIRLAGNRSYSRSLGKQARSDMQHQFSWTNTAKSLSELYVK
jgi:spore coat protein SA